MNRSSVSRGGPPAGAYQDFVSAENPRHRKNKSRRSVKSQMRSSSPRPPKQKTLKRFAGKAGSTMRRRKMSLTDLPAAEGLSKPNSSRLSYERKTSRFELLPKHKSTTTSRTSRMSIERSSLFEDLDPGVGQGAQLEFHRKDSQQTFSSWVPEKESVWKKLSISRLSFFRGRKKNVSRISEAPGDYSFLNTSRAYSEFSFEASEKTTSNLRRKKKNNKVVDGEEGKNSLRGNFRRFNSSVPRLEDKLLFAQLTGYQPCPKCSKILQKAQLINLLAANTILSESKKDKAKVRAITRPSRGKLSSVKEKEVEIELFQGRVELSLDYELIQSFHVSEIHNIEYNEGAQETIILSVFGIDDKTDRNPKGVLRKEEYVLTFDTVQKARKWVEYFLLSLKSMILIIDEILCSVTRKAHWENKSHQECLLRKKASILEVALPKKDRKVTKAYKEVLKLLVNAGDSEGITLFTRRIEDLEDPKLQGNPFFDGIRENLFYGDVDV
eukprot:snap_masked-scaffold_73-processed-gene-0.29-mRNA-1 protein AED:1.00 eAED:1.00 QI:0/-1/0/0/-1/1/1/0/495